MSIAYSDKPPSPAFLAFMRRQQLREAKQQAHWQQQREAAQKRAEKDAEALRREVEHRGKILQRQKEKAEKIAQKYAEFVYEQALEDARRERNRLRARRLAKTKAKIRSRIQAALRSQHAKKSNHTINLLGCSIRTFRRHIQRQFRPGMTWENHGLIWHIDHIRPCASFNLLDASQQRKCFNYKNTQPLFIKENLAKNSKWNGQRCFH